MKIDKGKADTRARDILLRCGRSCSPKDSPVELEIQPAPVETYRAEEAGLRPLCVRIAAATGLLGIGRTKICELIKRGELSTIKVHGAVLIVVASIDAFVARRIR